MEEKVAKVKERRMRPNEGWRVSYVSLSPFSFRRVTGAFVFFTNPPSTKSSCVCVCVSWHVRLCVYECSLFSYPSPPFPLPFFNLQPLVSFVVMRNVNEHINETEVAHVEIYEKG
jgi:hypothetical protein